MIGLTAMKASKGWLAEGGKCREHSLLSGGLQASEDAVDLLSRLVAFDPRKRLTAAEALQHPYFKSSPKPTDPGRLPKPPIRAHNPLKLQPEVSST